MKHSFSLNRVMKHPLQYETCKMLMGIGLCTLFERTVLYCFNEEKTELAEIEYYIDLELNQLPQTSLEQIVDGLDSLANRAMDNANLEEAAKKLPVGMAMLKSLDPQWIQIERCLWNTQYSEHGAIICCHCPWNESMAIYILIRGQKVISVVENSPQGEYLHYDAYSIWNQNDYFIDPAGDNPYTEIELKPVEALLKKLVKNAYSPVEYWRRMRIAQIDDPVIAGRVRDDCSIIFGLNTFLQHSSGAFIKGITCWACDSHGYWIDAGNCSENFGIFDIAAYQNYYFQPDGWEPTVYKLPKALSQPAPSNLAEYIEDILQSVIYNNLLRFSSNKIASPDTVPNYVATKPTYAPEVFSMIQATLFTAKSSLLYGVFLQMERGVFSIRVNDINLLDICPNPSQLLSGWIDYYMPKNLKMLLTDEIYIPIQEKVVNPKSDWHPNILRDFRPLQLNMEEYIWGIEAPAQKKLFLKDLAFLEKRFESISIGNARLYSICLHKLRSLFIHMWTDLKTISLWQSTLAQLSVSMINPYLTNDLDKLRDVYPTDGLNAYGLESALSLFEVFEDWNLEPCQQLNNSSTSAIKFWLEIFSLEAVVCAKNKKISADIRMKLASFPYGSVREPLLGTMHKFLDIITSGFCPARKMKLIDNAINKFQNWYSPFVEIMHELSGRNRGITNGQTAEVINLYGDERKNALNIVWRVLFKKCEFIEAIDILLDSLQSSYVYLSWKDFSYYIYWGWKAAPSGEYAYLKNNIAFITVFSSKQNPYLTIKKSEVASVNINEFKIFLQQVSVTAKEPADWESDIDEKIDQLMEAIEESINNKNNLN